MSALHGVEWPASHPRTLCLRRKLTQYPLSRIPTFLYKVASVSYFMSILRPCNISGFCYGADEAFALLRCCAAWVNFWLSSFRDIGQIFRGKTAQEECREQVDSWVKSLRIIPYTNTTADTIILQKAVTCVLFHSNDCMLFISTAGYAQLLPPPQGRLSELFRRFLRATNWTPVESRLDPSRQ